MMSHFLALSFVILIASGSGEFINSSPKKDLDRRQGGSSTVPADLSINFDTTQVELQVSYDGDSSEGFSDGTAIPFDKVQVPPTFALGDSSGVNTAARFIVMMVDTTCGENNRVLHFLQTGFSPSGTKTQLDSSLPPALTYKRPGFYNEKGRRQYSFLMYTQPSDSEITTVPDNSSPFNVRDFQVAHDLGNPIAGVGMFVQIGTSETNNCGAATEAETTTISETSTARASSTTSRFRSTKESTSTTKVLGTGSAQRTFGNFSSSSLRTSTAGGQGASSSTAYSIYVGGPMPGASTTSSTSPATAAAGPTTLTTTATGMDALVLNATATDSAASNTASSNTGSAARLKIELAWWWGLGWIVCTLGVFSGIAGL